MTQGMVECSPGLTTQAHPGYIDCPYVVAAEPPVVVVVVGPVGWQAASFVVHRSAAVVSTPAVVFAPCDQMYNQMNNLIYKQSRSMSGKYTIQT